MNFKDDHMATGLILGLLGPPVAFFVFSKVSSPDVDVMEVFMRYRRLNVVTHVISLAVLVNLPLFFVFLSKKMENAARGILAATFFFAFIVLILKFV